MTVSHVPLSALAIDPVNVRKTDIEPSPAFVMNIRAIGIKIPLLVRLNGEGYKVADGGKRLRALQEIAKAKQDIKGIPVTSEYPVPVTIEEATDEQARDTSLALNLFRDEMHPVDEFEACTAMIAGGDTIDGIAARYGTSKRYVQQSLALAALSPKIREAWRAGELDEEEAQAYTMAAEHADQERVFKKVGKRASDYQIRRAIVGDQDDAAKLLRFVGRKDYEAAGGVIIVDLFAEEKNDNSAVSDPKLLRKLADAKLVAKCAELKADGWSWAETREEAGHNTWNWTQLPGGKKQSPENMAKSGCLVELKHDGTLEIRYAMQKPSQQKKATKAAAKAKGEPVESTISNAMAHRLSCALTVAAAKAVEAEPALALTIAVATLISYEGSVKLRNDGFGAREIEYDEEFDAAFARIAKKSPKEQMALFAKLVGASFDFQNHNASRDPFEEEDAAATICNAIDAKRMNAALRETFDPKDYFGGISKAIIAQAVAEAMGKDHGTKVLKMKTGEAAAFAIANVPKTKWLPEQLRVAGYDGPGTKKAPAKKVAKKKAA